MDKKLSL